MCSLKDSPLLFNYQDDLKFDDPEFVFGKGAFGEVLRCYYTGPKRESSIIPDEPLAVKVLFAQGQTETALMDDFEREVWIMSMLQHNNIVRLYGVSFSPPAMLMEVVDGGDLLAQLQDPFSLGVVYSLWDSMVKRRNLHLLAVMKQEASWRKEHPDLETPERQQLPLFLSKQARSSAASQEAS